MKHVMILLVAIACFGARPAEAQLDLKASFGVDGLTAIQGQGPTDEGIVDMHVDATARVTFVYSGFGATGLGRLLPDGTLDAGFAEGGIVALGFTPAAVVVQADGGIVAGGTAGNSAAADWRLARFHADGTVDTAFGDAGVLNLDWFENSDEINALAIDSTGNIVVAGRAFDPSLGSGLAVAIFDDTGQIQAQRFTKLFTGTAEWCEDVLVQDNGRIVCVGLTRNFNSARMIALRYLADLEFDTTFGDSGLVVVPTDAAEMEARSGALTGTGQIVMGGWVDRASEDLNLAIVRLNGDGSVDATFGTGGLVETQITDDASELVENLMVDGTDLLVAATEQQSGDFAVLRFDVDGEPVATFGTSGVAQVDFNGLVDQARVLAMQQGEILVGGSASATLRSERSNIGLVRLQSNGVPDPAFADSGLLELGLSGPVRTIVQDAAARAGGGLVTAFWSGSSFSDREFALLGVRPDGEPDPDFGDNGVAQFDFANGEDTVEAVAVQPDGRIIAVGGIRQSTQGTDFGIVRFMPDGSVDTGFGIDGGIAVDLNAATDTARAVQVLDNGTILVAGEGQFFNSGGDGDLVVIRLLADGTLDTTFGTDGIARADSGASFEFCYALTVLADGRILVGGLANEDFVLAAFNADGSTDPGFGTAGIATLDFSGEIDVLTTLLTVPNWNGQGERIAAVGSARTGSTVTSADFAAAMFATDGTLETGFGDAGTATFDLSGGARDEATDAVLWQGVLVLAGFSTDPLGENGTDYALMGLDLDGQPLANFSVDGPTKTIDFFGDADDARAVVVGSNDLTLAGTVIDPLLPTFTSQLTGLARLVDVEMIFSDGFEG